MRTAGKAAEVDARWYIDRCLHGAKNWTALHDIILFDKRGDTWCQIDHLVFGRLGHFLVLETKSAKEGMSLDNKSGAFTVWFNGRPKPVKSPIAQNERHIEVLRDFVKERDLLPRRLGIIPIQPAFLNWILVQPGARLPLEYDGARLVQRDQFSKALDKLIDSIGVPDLIRLMSRESLAPLRRPSRTKPVRIAKCARSAIESRHLRPQLKTPFSRRFRSPTRRSTDRRSQLPSQHPLENLRNQALPAPSVQPS